MKFNYKSEKFIYIIIIVIAMAIFIFQFLQQRQVRDGEGARIPKTYNEFIQISKVIELTAYDNQYKQVPKQMDSLLSWLESFSLDWKEAVVSRNKRWFDPNSGALVDAWGEPIELEVKLEKEYVFIGSGPNKKFENGKGDDITYSFNPYEFKEKEK
jgi:hypothetical protein